MLKLLNILSFTTQQKELAEEEGEEVEPSGAAEAAAVGIAPPAPNRVRLQKGAFEVRSIVSISLSLSLVLLVLLPAAFRDSFLLLLLLLLPFLPSLIA